MAGKLHKTRGIVLRQIKFGETSLVVTIYTELFGVQSYIVNGVRVHSRKGAGKAALFQPAALLDLVVYHHDSAHLNRIREFHWNHLYEGVLSDVKKNAVAMFMMELVYKCLRQPEPNPELFEFCRDCLLVVDGEPEATVANMPLYFALHLASFLGFRVDRNHGGHAGILDLQEGSYIKEIPGHQHYLEGAAAELTASLLKISHGRDAGQVKLNQSLRRNLLEAYVQFYMLHLPDLGSLKTLAVLKALFE